MKENKFVNIPTQKFYEFLEQKVRSGDITVKEIAEKLDAYKSNPSSYLSALKTGKISVTVDQLLKAEQHFGFKAAGFFSGNSISVEADNYMVFNEDKAEYYTKQNTMKRISSILKDMIQESGITHQALSNETGYSMKDVDLMVEGRVIIPLDFAISISHLSGISMDRLRKYPLSQSEGKAGGRRNSA